MSEKKANFLVQAIIFSVIMLISIFISWVLKPFIPCPSSIIGMVLLFILLCCKVVKLEHVEELGNFLLDKIGFLFVPSGIALIKYLDIMKTEGLQISLIIGITTAILLVGTGWCAQLILGKKSQQKIKEIESSIKQETK